MTRSSTLRRGFPTLGYVAAPFRWAVRTRRRRWIIAALLVATMSAPALWWSIQLMGLPDIGDPFEKEALGAIRIADDCNAFVLYRQAAAVLKPLKSFGRPPGLPANQPGPWPQDDAEASRWVEENRGAMELYRRGTERTDALDLVPPLSPESWRIVGALRSLHVLAQLEAIRLEHEGDMAGAWGWYRAALRATHHMGLRSSLLMRGHAHRWHAELAGRLETWAADPRTTPAMLRRALDDVVACGSFTPSESYTLMVEYPHLERLLDSRDNPGRYVPLMRMHALFRSSMLVLTPEQMEVVGDAWRFWRREPERSRRVLRLIVANWMAYEAMPPERRPAPDLRLSGSYDFYTFGPDAPANARILPPLSLEHWLDTTTDASELLRTMGFHGLRLQERSSHRALVVRLASALYRRDHRVDPPSEQALVGPYLKELPDDGLGEAGWGSNPEGVQE
jgi:hypothetical protein